jgi:hypothetical protein
VRSDLGVELLGLMARDGWVHVYDAVEEDPAAVALIERLAVLQRKRWPSTPSPPMTAHPEPAMLPMPSGPGGK